MNVPQEGVARMRRVRLLTSALIVLTCLFCVYWTVHILQWVIPTGFTEQMQTLYLVDDDAPISTGQRAAFLAMWGVMIVVVWMAVIAALRLFLMLRSGAFFAISTIVQVQRVGVFLAIVAVCDTILTTVQNTILTWNNAPDSYIAPRYYFDGGDITMLLCGLGFFVVGWVLYEGKQIEAENKGFI